MEVNNNKSFIDKHQNATSVVSVIVWFIVLAIMWIFTSCKGAQNVVEIHTSDTIHVYHTDTIREVHNDTIKEKVVTIVRDSIIREIIVTNTIDQNGNVVQTEKETNNEVWHNSDTNTSLIQHTVDSLLQAKMDSIYNASHEDKPVVVERQKTWWEKFVDGVKSHFAWIGIILLIAGFIFFAWKTK